MLTATMPTVADLTAGVTLLAVDVPDTFVRARQLLGDDFHARYEYRVECVEDREGYPTYFLSAKTGSRFVYVGIVHPTKGSVRLTRKSAFPAHATRVRVADRVLQALFAGRADTIEAAGWTVTGEVVSEVAKW